MMTRLILNLLQNTKKIIKERRDLKEEVEEEEATNTILKNREVEETEVEEDTNKESKKEIQLAEIISNNIRRDM